MKKILLFLCLSVITSTLFAQHGNPYGNQYGTLTISSNNNQNFWLFIDDVLQNEYSTNLIRIQGLQFTYYKVRVEIDNPSFYTVGETILIYSTPNRNNYVVSLERGNFYSFKKTQTALNPYFIQNLILPNINYYSAYEQFLYPGFNPNVNYGQGYKGSAYKKYQYNNPGYGNPPGHGGNSPGHGNPQPPGYGNPPGHGNPQGHGNPPPPPPPPPSHQTGCMNPNDFNSAIAVIQRETFEDSKLGIAKQITSNNRLCVAQIMQICRLFSYENTKLDYAKYAYSYCFDRNNYFQLNDVFTYSSSKDELRKFIGN